MNAVKSRRNDKGVPLLPIPKRELPRVNLRVFLFTALGVIFGILIYCRCRFGGLKMSDFLLFALLLPLSFTLLSKKRALTIGLCFVLFAGAGAGLMHLYTQRFLSGREAGEYEVTGTVCSFTVEDGYSYAVLKNLSFDGNGTAGKLSLVVAGEDVRAGDKLKFFTNVARTELPAGDSYRESLFVKDIRYSASPEEYERVGKGDALCVLNGMVYDVLHRNMQKTQADTAYALLTGNSSNIDDSLTTAIRQGGIAHIFAVSGLHIGILYSAVTLLLKKLKGFRILPALALCLLYSAFCGFSVSSLRAVVMCGVLSVERVFGRKSDFLSAISFAATLLLLIHPADFLSASFRLSFGACVGLALYSGALRRKMKALPRILREYLSGTLAVQAFTFPILIETFGYCSVWGLVLNFFVLPALPVLFLGLFVCTLLSLIIPPAATVFLTLPNGMLTVMIWLFSAYDFSFVLTGISLGTAAIVFVTGVVLLSERVRFSRRVRAAFALLSVGVFTLFFTANNVTLWGCKMLSADNVVLIQTRRETVLIVGDISSSRLKDFVSRHFDGKFDAVIVLSENQLGAVNVALSCDFDVIYLSEETETGLRDTPIALGETFTIGALEFRYETQEKLTLCAVGHVAEIDFDGEEALSADVFISGENATYYFQQNAALVFG